MFDIAPSEFLLVAIIALVVIGPKDLPKAMRVLGYWVGRARGVARQFRSGFDGMVREAELAEMEKKWAEENARIMAEHSAGGPADAPSTDEVATTDHDASPANPQGREPGAEDEPDLFSQPVMVEQPVLKPAPGDIGPPADAKAPS
ncbi:Sec-independent protein translocase protein TatB [Sphingomonas sp.]|jgi:sec-independent protein translocase protein TatB|uniref:Sec-independent protein translocase protein TatB n=1 Tax=Sphingomonas sp. TaxID=28214 RepID=UPI002D80AF6E|nr:Sec-independent protein translocase protein TatB [Sphingomonas sp.]HEU0044327.1 Sec-independent protein translocase protein TatB [Sphingomonas sp.]